jgi:predicted dehydrogenase
MDALAGGSQCYSASLMRVAIVGCGLIGRKRAGALGGCPLAVCCDTARDRAEALARAAGAVALTDWREAVTRADVDIVLVSTTHDMLAPIAGAAAAAGKHVLIEKPGARRASELDPVCEAARRTGARVRVGFNHRYHRAFRKGTADGPATTRNGARCASFRGAGNWWIRACT